MGGRVWRQLGFHIYKVRIIVQPDGVREDGEPV